MLFGSKLTSHRGFLDCIVLVLRALDHGAEIWFHIVHLELDCCGRLVLVLQQIVLLNFITLAAGILEESLIRNLLRRHGPIGLVHFLILVFHVETRKSLHLALALLFSKGDYIQKLLIGLNLLPGVMLVDGVDLGGFFRGINYVIELQNIFVIIIVDFEDLKRPIRKVFLMVLRLLDLPL